MRKIVKSVFPFQVFPFVRYKVLLRFSIMVYFVSLFLFLFFGKKDDVLFPNTVERNVQSFTLSSAVQYYSQSFHDTKTSISAKTFIPQKSPYFLCKPRTWNSQTNGLKQNEWSFPIVWSREGGWGGGNELDWGGRSEKYVLKNTIETAKKNKRKKTRKTKKTVTPSN